MYSNSSPVPYLVAAYTCGVLAFAVYSLYLFLQRRKLRRLLSIIDQDLGK